VGDLEELKDIYSLFQVGLSGKLLVHFHEPTILA
jgi:hypothetical protein